MPNILFVDSDDSFDYEQLYDNDNVSPMAHSGKKLLDKSLYATVIEQYMHSPTHLCIWLWDVQIFTLSELNEHALSVNFCQWLIH